MKRSFKVLAFLAVILAAIALISCSGGNSSKLEKPKDLKLDGFYLSWSPVAKADGYLVDIEGETYEADTERYSLGFLTEPNTYEVKVKALGNGADILDSEWSDSVYYTVDAPVEFTELQKPTGLSVSGGVLTWNAVSGAQRYAVDINGSITSVTATQMTLTVSDVGVYNIKVRALGNGSNYLDSEWSDVFAHEIVPIELQKPAGLSVTNSVLTWTAVTNATRYEIDVAGSVKSAAVNSLTLTINDVGNYEIKVRAIGNGAKYLNSEWSDVFEYEIIPVTLETPSGLAVDNGILTWTDVPGVISYTVKIDDDEYDDINDNQFSVAFLTAGDYEISVRAMGNGARYLTSDWSEIFDYTVAPGPVKLDEPSNLNVDNGVLVWDGAAEAVSYTVSIDGEEYDADAESFTLDFLTEPGSYEIKIMAKGDGVLYLDSDWSEIYTHVVDEPEPDTQPLPKPAGFSVVQGELTWGAVADAVGYIVKIGAAGEEVPVTDAAYPLSALTEPAVYTVMVKAVADGEEFTDSPWASYDYIITETLDKPDGLNIENGILEWNAVTNADSYTVDINGVAYSVTANKLSLVEILDTDDYVIKVKAKSSNVIYLDSVWSDETDYTHTPYKLSAPNGIALEDDVLLWEAVAYAAEYEIIVENVTSRTTDGLFLSLDFLTDAATYVIRVMAVGNGTTILDSDLSASINYIVTKYAGGDGTSENPYEIADAEQLIMFADRVNALANYSRGLSFRLIGDIDLLGANWTPVGRFVTVTDYTFMFQGNFDGGGYTVSNFNVSGKDAGGFFGAIYNAVISGVNIENVSVFANANTVKYLGGVAGYAKDSTINGSGVSGLNITSANGTRVNGGGIIGYAENSTIKNSYADADINVSGATTATYAGGLLGRGINVNILGSYAFGTAEAAGGVAYAGGLVGRLAQGGVADSFATAAPVAASYVGALIGMAETAASVKNSYYFETGYISGLGALTSVQNLQSAEWLSGTLKFEEGNPWVLTNGYYPSLTGENLVEIQDGCPLGSIGNPIEITDAAELVAISANKAYVLTADIDLGGAEWTPFAVYNSVFDGGYYIIKNFKITAFSAYAGIFGRQRGIVKNLGAEDFRIDVKQAGSADLYAGGIAGESIGVIMNCYSTGDTKISAADGRAFAGGILGYNGGSVLNSYSSGAVTVSSKAQSANAGGLVGKNGGSIENCYAAGNTSASSDDNSANAGGLVGENEGSIIASFSASRSLKAVSVGDYVYVGGLVGRDFSGTITGSYRWSEQAVYRKDKSGEPRGFSNSLGATRNTSVMSGADFYLSELGWSGELWTLTGLNISAEKYPVITAFVRTSEEGEPITLDRPTKLTVDESYNLTWLDIADAVSYEIDVDGQISQSEQASFSLALIGQQPGWHEIRVRAIGDGADYLNSPWSIILNYEIPPVKLQTPTGLRVEGKTLQWNAITNASGYQIEINGKIQPTLVIGQTSFSLADLKTLGVYGLRVRAIGDGTAYMDSNLSNSVNYTLSENLTQPDGLKIVNGVLSWTEVNNAVRYEVEISGESENKKTTDTKWTLTMSVPQIYEIRVKAIGDETKYVDSSWSDCISYAVYGGGYGTRSSPFIIKTKVQLEVLASAVNTIDNYSKDLHFALGGSIDLGGAVWMPIGYFSGGADDYTRAFQGHFDGRGFKIHNFKLSGNASETDMKTYGLFGVLAEAQIVGLTVEPVTGANLTVAASASSTVFFGGLAGYAYNTVISSSTVTFNVTLTLNGDNGGAGVSLKAGGALGGAYGCSLTTVTSKVGLTIASNAEYLIAGGAVGEMSNAEYLTADGAVAEYEGNIDNSRAEGNVMVSFTGATGTCNVGGFAGYFKSGNITGSYALGNVSVTSATTPDVCAVGGFIGFGGSGEGGIVNCYAEGAVSVNVSGTVFAGGLIGKGGMTVSGCYALGDVTAASGSGELSVGGLIGEFFGITGNSYAAGNVVYSSASSVFAGGLIGFNSGAVRGCYATGNVLDSAISYEVLAGGLIGCNTTDENVVSSSYAKGFVKAEANGFAYAGGFIGYSYDSAAITNCYASGSAEAYSVSESAYAGGFIAMCYGDIADCYARGKATARSDADAAYAGGFAAYISGNIQRAYARGSVSAYAGGGDSYAGGFAAYKFNGDIGGVVAVGNVFSHSVFFVAYAGGLIGRNGSGEVFGYVYITQSVMAREGALDKGSTNNIGTECSEENLNDPVFFTETLGFNDEVWTLTALDFEEGFYPCLSDCADSMEGEKEPLNLASPEGIYILDGTLYWDTVSHALSYLIDINGMQNTSVMPWFRLDYLTVAGVYTIKIIAVGDGVEYLNSAWSEDISYRIFAKISAPDGLQFAGSVLSWTPVTDAAGYVVSIDGVVYPVPEGEASLNLDFIMSKGLYAVRVMTFGDNEIYGDSNWSSAITYEAAANISLGTAAVFQSGEGTKEAPYIISTKEQLKRLSALTLSGDNYTVGKYFELGNDINLDFAEWQPIGYFYGDNQANYTRTFQGNFDGRGYKIYNFRITSYVPPVAQYASLAAVGLFGAVHNATISNLTVESFTLSVAVTKKVYAGLLAGYTDRGTVITNCSAEGSLTVSSSGGEVYAGGFIGYSASAVTLCGAEAEVTASTAHYLYTGGFIAYNSGTVTNCYASGNVSSTLKTAGSLVFNAAGGFVGYADAASVISNAYAAGNVYATSATMPTYAGGFGGYTEGGSKITNCYATGDVTAVSVASGKEAAAGGFIGKNYGAADNCYRYAGQTVVCVQGGTGKAANTTGKTCTEDELNSRTFYTNTLKWSETVWYIYSLDFFDGIYPKLIKN